MFPAAHPPPLVLDDRVSTLVRCASPGPSRPGLAAPPPPTDSPVDADPAGSWPHTLTSQHFVLKWGDTGDFSDEDVLPVLDSLERAWTVEVDTLGYLPPPQSELYLVDVFLGDTGPTLPETFGARGYEGRYEDGRAYLVIHPGLLDWPELLEVTAAHELFHAVQDGSGAAFVFGPDQPGAFYFEASAMWMESQVMPDTDDWYSWVWAYASTIREPLRQWAPVDGSALGSRAYGLAILPWFFADQLGPAVIRQSWEASDEPDPIAQLRAAIEAEGADPDALFSDFAAHNAVWDYPDRRALTAQVADHGRDGDMYQREPALMTDPRTIDPEEGPGEGGTFYARIPLSGFEERVHIQLSGDTAGSAGSTPRWDLRVVIADEADPRVLYPSLPTETGVETGSFSGEVLPDGLRTVVLAATPWGLSEGERAGLSYAVTRVDTQEDPDVPTKAPPGCACASGGAGPVATWTPMGVLLLVAGWWARARPSRA